MRDETDQILDELDENRAVVRADRIAALEARVARLTAVAEAAEAYLSSTSVSHEEDAPRDDTAAGASSEGNLDAALAACREAGDLPGGE